MKFCLTDTWAFKIWNTLGIQKKSSLSIQLLYRNLNDLIANSYNIRTWNFISFHSKHACISWLWDFILFYWDHVAKYDCRYNIYIWYVHVLLLVAIWQMLGACVLNAKLNNKSKWIFRLAPMTTIPTYNDTKVINTYHIYMTAQKLPPSRK